MNPETQAINRRARELRASLEPLYREIGRVLVGQRALVDRLLAALLTGGHVLLEGVPGLAKTLAVRTLARALRLSFSRIQFTPDLLPADVIGTQIYNPRTGDFTVKRGPVFANFVLADEINRAPAKVQSALLEAMQEKQVTIGDTTYPLSEPFMVLATQNPIEQEGTYPLPEAQLDRFLFKLVVGYSTREEIATILDRTTRGERPHAEKVIDGDTLIQMQALVREVLVAPHVQDYAIRLGLASHPEGPHAVDITNQYIRWGSSPRGVQTLVLAAKVRALLDGRYNVSYEDLRRVYLPSLRHRVLLNFEAQAEGVEADDVLLKILDAVPEKAEEKVTAKAV